MVVRENRAQISKRNNQTLHIMEVCCFLYWVDMYEREAWGAL